jgi:hypothetical protein
MRFFRAGWLGLALVAVSSSAPPQQKTKKADVQVIETKAVRDGPNITVDGRVRVTTEKGVRGLVLVFDFRSPEKAVITSQTTVVDDGVMDTGKEGSFHAEMADSVRAVSYVVRATDMHERELHVANPGPFPIE